jgi:hypothetical protein
MSVPCRHAPVKEGHTACSPAWSAVAAPCWAVADRGSRLLGSRGASRASGRRSGGSRGAGARVLRGDNVPVAAKRWWAVTKRVARPGSRDHCRPKQLGAWQHTFTALHAAYCFRIESHIDACTARNTSTACPPPAAVRRAEQLAVLRIVVGGEESQIGAIPHRASKRCPSH